MSESGGRNLLPWIILGATIALIALVGGLLLSRIDRIGERLDGVQGQLKEVVSTADAARTTAEAAQRKAQESEELSRIAAEGRRQAEADRADFEVKALQARDQADSVLRKFDEAQQELDVLRRERNAEMSRLQKALNRIAATRRTREGLIMSLGTDSINFDFDKAALRPEERELLSRIAGILLTSSGYRVQVYGHTDDVGTAQYNLELSEQRAAAVEHYLIEAGIDPSIITMKGFGKANPLVRGTSSDARAKNRRVEIGIIDTVIKYHSLVDEDPSSN
jgi:outer membrane protein OmpA-like peptidoglycan-associated protein